MTTETISEELKRINASIPKQWMESIAIEVSVSPTISKIVDIALKDDSISEEKKKELQLLKDTGHFNKKKVIENKKVAKLINEYISREIKKSVKAGRLPDKKQLSLIMKKNDKTTEAKS